VFQPGAGLGQSRQHKVQFAHGDDQPGAVVGRIDRDRLAEQRAGAFGRRKLGRRQDVGRFYRGLQPQLARLCRAPKTVGAGISPSASLSDQDTVGQQLP